MASQSLRPGGMLDLLCNQPAKRPIGDGAFVLHGFAVQRTGDLLCAIEEVRRHAPLRKMVTPGGHTMSVAMTNCGELGWVTDRRGYRYQPHDPIGGAAWPAMPPVFRTCAADAAALGGYGDFMPDACLINCYEPGARLSLHQDRNEIDLAQPIVSVSLGLPAVFLFGGLRRSDPPRRIRLEHGDVVVWGGATRMAFHGVAALPDGEHPATGRCRINLTFRKAG